MASGPRKPRGAWIGGGARPLGFVALGLGIVRVRARVFVCLTGEDLRGEEGGKWGWSVGFRFGREIKPKKKSVSSCLLRLSISLPLLSFDLCGLGVWVVILYSSVWCGAVRFV